MFNAREGLQNGYKKVLPLAHVPWLTEFPNTFWRTQVFMTDYIIVDRAHLKEYYDVPSHTFSFDAAVWDALSMKHTLKVGPSFYHVDIVKNQLTRNFGSMLPDLAEEVRCVLAEEWPATDGAYSVQGHY